MSTKQRPARLLEALAKAAGGLSTPQLVALIGEGIQPHQRALTRYGGILRQYESAGRIERAGQAAGGYQRGPAVIWRITDAGREWLRESRQPQRLAVSAPLPVTPPAVQPALVPLLIQGLVRRLPPLGRPFPPAARERWLEALRVNLDLIYGDDDEEMDVG